MQIRNSWTFIFILILVSSCGGKSGEPQVVNAPTQGMEGGSAEQQTSTRVIDTLVLNTENDVNSDGIRDDVNQFINAYYGTSATLLSATEKFAYSVNSFATATTSEQANTRYRALQLAIECLFIDVNTDTNSDAVSELIADIEGATFSTAERARAYFLTDQLISEYVFNKVNPTEDQCV